MPAKRMYDVMESAEVLKDVSGFLTKGEWDKVMEYAERYQIVHDMVSRMATRDPNRDYEGELKTLIFETLKDSKNPAFQLYQGDLFIQFDGKLGPIFKLEIKSRMRRRAKNEAPIEKVKRGAKKRSDLPVKQQ